MLFKFSNLNSNLALTVGYFNPAVNNSAQKLIMDDHNNKCCLCCQLTTVIVNVIIGSWRYKDIDEHHHAAKEDL